MNEIASLQGVPAATGNWESGAPHGGIILASLSLHGARRVVTQTPAGREASFISNPSPGIAANLRQRRETVGNLSAGAWCPGPIEGLKE